MTTTGTTLNAPAHSWLTSMLNNVIGLQHIPTAGAGGITLLPIHLFKKKKSQPKNPTALMLNILSYT